MQKGTIGVTTENIFPIIKQFLYSDREIFLREIVSNAVDATQKLKTLASKGDFKGEMGDLTVHVTVNKDNITVSDRGIGMTAAEIDKYINQIAFSGANDFLEKYKNDANAIIGHFDGGSLEERHETLLERNLACLDNTWLLFYHSQDALVEVISQRLVLLLCQLIDKEVAILLQLSRDILLTEESTQDTFLFERGLCCPVAFQELFDVLIIHYFT